MRDEQAEVHLDLWWAAVPDHLLLNVRPIRKRGDGKTSLGQRFFRADETNQILEFAEEAEEHGDDVFLGCLPRAIPDGGKKAVAHHSMLWADLDVGTDGHKKGGQFATRNEALGALARCPVPPNLSVWSGGGVHAWWMLDGDLGEEAWLDAIRRVSHAIGSDEAVSFPAHVLRLAGTKNYKLEQPRDVELLSMYPEPIPASALDRLPKAPEKVQEILREMEHRPAARTTIYATDRPFDRANDVPVLDIAKKLGVKLVRQSGGFYGACPVHKGENPSMRFGGRRNVATCFSDCGQKAYTAVDLVAGALEIEPEDAVQWICEQFGMPGWSVRAKGPQGGAPRSEDRQAPPADAPPPAPPSAPGAAPPGPPEPPGDDGGDDGDDEDDDEWKEKLILPEMKGSRPLACLANVALILNHDPEWKGVVRYNAFSCKVERAKLPPSNPDERCDYEFEAGSDWEDADDSRSSSWMQRKHRCIASSPQIYEAIHMVARRRSYHPVRDYLEGLQWDGKSRLRSWLIDYAGVQRTPYSESVGWWFLLSAVARIFHPGCQADHVLILEGLQGIGKSSLVKILVRNRDWYTDHLGDVTKNDAPMMLRGRWMIEIPELNSFLKATDNEMKEFITRQEEKFRRPYGRNVEMFKRQCVMVGTVNHGGYFRDITGNRRYWPVYCEWIDFKKLEEDVDQLWAEAVVAFHDGKIWWPETEAERLMCAAEQDKRLEEHPWERHILTWLCTPRAEEKMKENGGGLFISDILEGRFNLEYAKQDKRSQGAVSSVLHKIGWHAAERARVGKSRAYLFVPPAGFVEDLKREMETK